MEVTFSIKKDQLTELFGASLGGQGKLKTIRVRTAEGTIMDFEDLVFIADMPFAIKK
jgi:hypothetical protein